MIVAEMPVYGQAREYHEAPSTGNRDLSLTAARPREHNFVQPCKRASGREMQLDTSKGSSGDAAEARGVLP
jgi:hypothetical protein